MALIDTSLRRESNCPVHFVWDGNGVGRPVVRVGFLVLVVAGLLLSAGVMLHQPGLSAIARGVTLAGVGVWGLGQVLTRLAVRRGTPQISE